MNMNAKSNAINLEYVQSTIKSKTEFGKMNSVNFLITILSHKILEKDVKFVLKSISKIILWSTTAKLPKDIDVHTNAPSAKVFAIKISTMKACIKVTLIATKKTMFLLAIRAKIVSRLLKEVKKENSSLEKLANPKIVPNRASEKEELIIILKSAQAQKLALP